MGHFERELTMPWRSKLRLSLSTQVLIGLILGLLASVVFGDLMVPLQDVGKAFIYFCR
jgi:hypothetical protein